MKPDKGSDVVIVDVYDDVKEANRQLNNRESCKKLSIGTTDINRVKVN